jgi:hypothetical protein
MWKRLSLRARILVLLIALVLTTIGGGVVTLWHNEAMDSLLTSLIDKNVASYHAAEELENALLQQKGYLTTAPSRTGWKRPGNRPTPRLCERLSLRLMRNIINILSTGNG